MAALEGLGLGGAGAGEAEAAAAPRPKRFRKLATMTAVEMLETGPDKLKEILSAAPGSGGAPSAAAPAAATVAASRYEQIRRRGGLTNFEVTEAASDPLRDVSGLCDVVRMDAEGPGATTAAGLAPEESALLCNFLPMVREYLDEEAAKHGADSAGDMDADGYVYDLYVEASAADTEGDEGWHELHARGQAPVVHIVSDDVWLVEEASDADDSGDGSEDSNAEDYFGNDYPEEGAWDSDSSASSGGGGGGRKKEWFDESDGSDD